MEIFAFFEFLCWLGTGRYEMGIGLIVVALLLSFLVSPWLLLVTIPGIAIIVWKYIDDRSWNEMGPRDGSARLWD
ncbi:MAG: hypothetical protein KF784_11645 [Fimbriimonadaceae bacterium]|nr:hypothetical protein [Fimbriimonadaceae bacterium]